MNHTTSTQSLLTSWVRAFAVGQVVQDSTIKRLRVGTIVGLDTFGYMVEFQPGAKSFMPEWQLAPAPHKTRTTEPTGYHVSDVTAGRDDRQGRVFDGTSTAICLCGWRQTCGSRVEARRVANQHKGA